MSDYFALLGEPRRPWLDLDRLKAKYLEMSTALHPDHHHTAVVTERQRATDESAELNAAYRCLSDPRERVLHLLELEQGRKPEEIQSIADHLMSVGMEVAQLCRQIDLFLAATPATTSPLLQVQRFTHAQDWTEKVRTLQGQLIARRTEAWHQLEQVNPLWEKAPPIGSPGRTDTLSLATLEEQFRLLSYFDRWLQQLQSRVTQLAL